MKIDTHVHSHYSHSSKVHFDGVASPTEMVRAEARAGMDAMALTDHNTMKGIKEARAAAKKHGIVLIPGEEINTLDGHVVALGIGEAIPRDLPAEETVDRIHTQGGIAISPHPFDIGKYGLGKKALLCDAIEIFNAINNDRFSNRRSRNFAKRNNLVGVGGSDAHHPLMVAHAVNEVKADGMDSALRAIRKGNVSVSARYTPLEVIRKWSVARLQMSHAQVLDYIDSNYSWPKRAVSRKLLGLAMKSPGKVDSLFKFFTYMSFGGVVAYSGFSQMWGRYSRA